MRSATLATLAQLPYEDEVNGVAFLALPEDSKGEQRVVSGSNDGTVRACYLRSEDLVAAACAYRTRNLTRAEWKQYLPGQPYRQTCEQWPLEPELAPTPTPTPKP